MVYSTENFYKTFELVRKRIPYKVCIKAINPEEIIIRSDIKDLTEASQFIQAYEAVTQARFKVFVSKSVMNSPVCRRKWICQHRAAGSINEKCPAKINVLIKKNNKYNKARDAFLRRDPPFPAVIKIDPNHNHSLTIVNPTPLKLLKVNTDVKECFYEYFKRGISGARAKRLHEYNLRKANFHALDDSSMNPHLPAIYTLYKNWLKLKENVRLEKALASRNSRSLQASNVETNTVRHSPPDNNFINLKTISKFEHETEGEYAATEKIADEVLEDVKPVLNIKKEIEDVDDDNDGLPVISSYGSLAAPPVQNIATVVRVQPATAQFVVYDKSSNTYKVVKCLSVCSKYTSGVYSSSQYNSHLPGALLPTRIALQKL